MIEAADVAKRYSLGSREVDALKGVSFDIAAGERVALLGKSGSGKTTLLNLLAGLDHPSSGKLKVGDVDLAQSSIKQADDYRRSMVGVVFQQFRLIKHKTAYQNIELPLIFSGVGKQDRRQRVTECLEMVGLSDRSEHKPSELSGGEQQRVAVARAISNRPQVLLADEPTGNLDSSNSKQIMDSLIEVHERAKATLVLITHDEQIASEYTSRILRLRDGSLIDDAMIDREREA